jgi:hypothetical protein
LLAEIQHYAGREPVAELVTEPHQVAKVIARYRCRRLHLDRGDPPVPGREDQVDLAPVAVTENS